MKKEFEIINYDDGSVRVEVNFDKENETVWMSQKQMTE